MGGRGREGKGGVGVGWEGRSATFFYHFFVESKYCSREPHTDIPEGTCGGEEGGAASLSFVIRRRCGICGFRCVNTEASTSTCNLESS